MSEGIGPADVKDTVSRSAASRRWGNKSTRKVASSMQLAASASQPAAAEAQTIAGQAISTPLTSHEPGADATVLTRGGYGTTASPYFTRHNSGLFFAEAIGIMVFIAYIGDPADEEEAGWIFAERVDDPSSRGWIPACIVAADSGPVAHSANGTGASSPRRSARDSLFACDASYSDGSEWL